MRADKADTARDLLSSLRGAEGMARFERVRVVQDVLREPGAGAADPDADRLACAVFGDQASDRPWGLQVQGHHLSPGFALIGGETVPVTPSSLSSNPDLVGGGRHDGLVAPTLDHAGTARSRCDLLAGNARRASIAERPLRNLTTIAGRENRLFAALREGVPPGDRPPAQRDPATRIVDACAIDHPSGPLAAAQAIRVREADPERIHLARAGGTNPGELMDYRLHGQTFANELATKRPEPVHRHRVRTTPPEPVHRHRAHHHPARHRGRHALAS